MAKKPKLAGLLSPGVLLRALGTVLALALVVYLVSQQGWDEISAAIRRIEVWRFVLVLLLTIISRFAVAGRWYVLLRSGGVETTWMQSLRITFAGLFANNFLPSTVGGDVARMAGALQAGYDATVSAASLVADRLVGLAGFAFTLPLGLRYVAAAQLGAAGSTPLALAAGTNEGWWDRASGLVKKVWVRLFNAIKRWLNEPKALLAALLLTFVHMTCLFGTLYVLLVGMHDPLPFWDVAGLQSLVYIVTLIPISISGWGLQEISISYAFSTLAGVTPANSLVLALMIRTLYILVSLPGALVLSDVLPGMAKARPLLNKLDG